MSINLGSTKMAKLYLGSTKISQAYLGDTKFFDATQPQPTGGRFILAGKNYIFHSSDGENWDYAPNPLAGSLMKVLATNNQIIAYPSPYYQSVSNNIMYSEDGNNWTQTTVPYAPYRNSTMCYNNLNQYVYFTANSSGDTDMAVSRDGRTWSAAPARQGSFAGLIENGENIIYEDDITAYINPSNGYGTYFCIDAINFNEWRLSSWTARSLGIRKIVVGENGIVLAFGGNNTGWKYLVKSTDSGLHFTRYQYLPDSNCTDVLDGIYLNGAFLCTLYGRVTSTTAKIIRSTNNGSSWTVQVAEGSHNFMAGSLVNHDNIVLALPSSGETTGYLYSNDYGVNWVEKQLPVADVFKLTGAGCWYTG